MKYLWRSAADTDNRPLFRTLRLQTNLQAKSQPAFRLLSSRLKSYLAPKSFLQTRDSYRSF